MFNKYFPDMKYLTITIFFILLVLLIVIFYKKVYEGLFIAEPPYFNFGTREWWPTRNMSYDIRGEPIIPYYNVSPFYNPEYPVKYYPRYINMDYNYYIPGLYPPIFATPYSIPFAVNNNKKK